MKISPHYFKYDIKGTPISFNKGQEIVINQHRITIIRPCYDKNTDTHFYWLDIAGHSMRFMIGEEDYNKINNFLKK